MPAPQAAGVRENHAAAIVVDSGKHTSVHARAGASRNDMAANQTIQKMILLHYCSPFPGCSRDCFSPNSGSHSPEPLGCHPAAAGCAGGHPAYWAGGCRGAPEPRLLRAYASTPGLQPSPRSGETQTSNNLVNDAPISRPCAKSQLDQDLMQ